MKPLPTGLNLKEITLYTESENLKEGMTVSLDSNGKAVLSISNTRFIGICTKVNGNYITVAVSGVVTVPYTGQISTYGYEFLSADGSGNIKFNATGETEYLIFDIDEENHLITFML